MSGDGGDGGAPPAEGPYGPVEEPFENVVIDVSPSDGTHLGLPEVAIYGDPAGLRALAADLLALADDPNTPPFATEGEHWHRSPAGGPGVGLHPCSVPLRLGRLDRPDDGSHGWILDFVRRAREDHFAAWKAERGGVNG